MRQVEYYVCYRFVTKIKNKIKEALNVQGEYTFIRSSISNTSRNSNTYKCSSNVNVFFVFIVLQTRHYLILYIRSRAQNIAPFINNINNEGVIGTPCLPLRCVTNLSLSLSLSLSSSLSLSLSPLSLSLSLLSLSLSLSLFFLFFFFQLTFLFR